MTALRLAETAAGAPISLTLDEYESIRLIDLEKRTHAQCAEQMGVSPRQSPKFTNAHKAGRLSRQRAPLQITGGHYRLCDGTARCGGVPLPKIRRSTDAYSAHQNERSKQYENRSNL